MKSLSRYRDFHYKDRTVVRVPLPVRRRLYIGAVPCQCQYQYHNWGFLHKKQLYQVWISNRILQNTVRCNYFSLLEIPASATKVYDYIFVVLFSIIIYVQDSSFIVHCISLLVAKRIWHASQCIHISYMSNIGRIFWGENHCRIKERNVCFPMCVSFIQGK